MAPLDPEHHRIVRAQIGECLREAWAPLDVILEAYTEALSTEQLTAIIRARELLVEVLVDVESA